MAAGFDLCVWWREQGGDQGMKNHPRSLHRPGAHVLLARQIEIGLFVNGRQSLKDEMDCQGANAEGKDKEIAFLSRTRPIQTVRALHLPQIMR